MNTNTNNVEYWTLYCIPTYYTFSGVIKNHYNVTFKFYCLSIYFEAKYCDQQWGATPTMAVRLTGVVIDASSTLQLCVSVLLSRLMNVLCWWGWNTNWGSSLLLACLLLLRDVTLCCTFQLYARPLLKLHDEQRKARFLPFTILSQTLLV